MSNNDNDAVVRDGAENPLDEALDRARQTYADGSNQLLIRERAAIISQLQGIVHHRVNPTIKSSPGYLKHLARREADLQVVQAILHAEIDRRREAGLWSEPLVPVPAAFVALDNELTALDAEVVAVHFERAATWDGGGEDVAFDIAVLSRRGDEDVEWLAHRGTVRCKHGELTAVLGGGTYEDTRLLGEIAYGDYVDSITPATVH